MNITIPEDVMFRILADEAVILNLASGYRLGQVKQESEAIRLGRVAPHFSACLSRSL
jgi:hypothetical protein